MPDLPSFLSAVRDRLAKATPGPWKSAFHPPSNTCHILDTQDRVIATLTRNTIPSTLLTDADLIYHAPTELTHFLALAEAALEMETVLRQLQKEIPPICQRLINDALTNWHATVKEVIDA